MIESTQRQKIACCAPMAAQRATFEDSSATLNATPNATKSLKVLAGAVLERNIMRNTNATEAEKQRNFCNEKTPEKLRSVAVELRPEIDDRHHCRECRHLSNSGYCIRQRFRPVDDIPRRCEDFSGHLARIGQRVSGTAAPAPATDPLQVTVYVPSGTSMTIRADHAEHVDWLKRMNPKPANPAPKLDLTPEPDADRISEAEHNAQGRYFKFLATWEDGRQCYLCQMPRQTVDEMRAQYPTAAHIVPITGEDYQDD